MAMSVTKIEATAQIKAWTTNTADQTETAPNATFLTRLFDTLLNGTGSDQANQVWADSNTILAGATNQIDTVGTLVDIYGTTISFTKIKGIILKNTSTTASVLALGGGTDGAGTNAFDTWITSAAADGSERPLVRPGGVFMLYTPDSTAYAASAGSDILSVIETSTLAGAYDIALIGVV